MLSYLVVDQRFKLSNATLLAADSNAYAGDLTHPDGAPHAEGVISYTYFARGTNITVYYPHWLPDWQQRKPAARI